MTTTPLHYQQQDSQQTLAEGLAEYFAAHEAQLSSRISSEAARDFFTAHDTAHVMFGCDINLADEAYLKICSMFGTSEGMGVLRGYALAESKEIYSELSRGEIVQTAFRSLMLVPRALWRCLRMRERWPWRNHQEFVDEPLHKIRARFGIRVPHTIVSQ